MTIHIKALTSKKQIFITLMLGFMCSLHSGMAQKTPFFEKGQDPKPANTKWKLVKNMSDEFNGKRIDEAKWQISGQGWIGRAPGLFLAENIEVSNGSLKVTATMLDKPIVKKGKTYTHGGGYVGSRAAMKYGFYECEMKANKTFMSSTFWLINNKRGASGCEKRTTELDIQECVGQINSDAAWMVNFDAQMNSNTHSRDIPAHCDYVKGSNKGPKATVEGKVYDDFHVYGVWWKSKDEVLFFLDGKLQSSVTPPDDFDIEMHLRMVVETYNWNPVPEDGGMNLSKKDRTTTYNWVRSWKLVNK